MSQEFATNNPLYRMIVSRDQGEEVWLRHVDDQYRIPCLPVPLSARFAEAVTCWASNFWNCDLLYLFSGNVIGAAHPEPIPYMVLEIVPTRGIRCADYAWVAVKNLSAGVLSDHGDYALIAEAIEHWRNYCQSPPGPFARPGWWRELLPKIAATIRIYGYEIERLQQLNGGPSFTLLRITTTGPSFWFKAVGEPNTHEFPITWALANHIRTHVPRLLEAFAECNGWLATEAEGMNLREAKPQHWIAAGTALAELQIASVEHGSRLRQAGARDLSLSMLASLIESTLGEISDAMREQIKVFPTALHDHELEELGSQLQTALKEANELQIPETLVHLDLNLGNVIVSASECTFLDWSEAYFGYPFCSIAYLAEPLRRRAESTSESIESLEQAYWSRWQTILPFETIAKARKLTPLIAIFAYAVALLRNGEPNPAALGRHRAYLRSLARRMKHEADQLLIWRLECIPL